MPKPSGTAIDPDSARDSLSLKLNPLDLVLISLDQLELQSITDAKIAVKKASKPTKLV
jgi:hypothetical protein